MSPECPAHAARALLREILGILRRAEETPLGFHVDGAGIADRVLRRQAGAPGACAGDPRALERALDEALARSASLGPSEGGCGRGTDSRRPTRDLICALAAWVNRLHATLRATHPRAASVVVLQLDGCDDHEIADRLELGTRLVGRIGEEVRRSAPGGAAS